MIKANVVTTEITEIKGRSVRVEDWSADNAVPVNQRWRVVVDPGSGHWCIYYGATRQEAARRCVAGIIVDCQYPGQSIRVSTAP